jgi:hypothetical protein
LKTCRQVARQREEAAATFEPELSKRKEQEKLKRSVSQVHYEVATTFEPELTMRRSRRSLGAKLLEKRGMNRGMDRGRGLGIDEPFFCDSCSNLEIDEAFQISHKLGLDLAE